MASSRTESSSPVEKEDVLDQKEALVVDEVEFDEKFVRRTKLKVDLRLLPILGAIYSFSLIDRINLASVRVSGADKALHLSKGDHYSIATTVFFIGYVLLEVPSNLVFRRVGASLFLGTIGLLWGVIMLSMGFVKTWYQLAGLRGVLGIFEAGYFPACVWLISCWYTRAEVQVRMAAFYVTAVIVGSFASIIAYGLSQLKTDHLAGWRWILIVEGIITCGLSLIGYYLIVDFPDKNKFLTPEETALIQRRVDRDRADGEYDPLTWGKLFEYMCDLKILVFSLSFTATTMAAYAYAYFLPIILVGLGYNVKQSLLLNAPVGIVSAVFAFGTSKLADRYRSRGPVIIAQCILSIIGLAMTGYHHSGRVRFAGTFLGYAGAQGNVPALLAYQTNNVRRQSKRAYASAVQVAFGGIGGIIASFAYREKDTPKYRPGINTTIALQVMTIVLVAVNTIWFVHCNRQVAKGKRIIEGQPGFMYTI